ncbi:MAG: 4-(cytidine 5'-diphospho)-2-C-methyl-D-erythritol kinase [Alphaproteobacteria bacterium]|nr:MAG: 4-(cytidine 5'-diphospho)-2-C-methyl-D-erythritol kinase [Alphaproteobacteria bacterium]
MKVVRETAPAKLNLFLHLIGRRDDGYHEIDSLFVFLDLADTLEARPYVNDGRAEHKDRLRISGPWAAFLDPPCEVSDNLILRALDEFRSRIAPLPPLDLNLHKRIPVAAGLGGGSADAAAALRIAARLTDTHLDGQTMADLALALGADVPACLANTPQWIGGIGEHRRPVRLPRVLSAAGVLLVNPRCPVNTAAVFGRFRDSGAAFRPPLTAMPWQGATDENVLSALARMTFNDLEMPAVEVAPEVGEVLAELRRPELGARLARMSGSGGTCFALFDNLEASRRAARQVTEQHPDWWTMTCRMMTSMTPALVGRTGD